MKGPIRLPRLLSSSSTVLPARPAGRRRRSTATVAAAVWCAVGVVLPAAAGRAAEGFAGTGGAAAAMVAPAAAAAGAPASVAAATPAAAAAAPPAPALAPREGDCTLKDFRFAGGEVMPALRIHYVSLGTPARDSSGVVRNAVLILHGTTGSGQAFLADAFAGQLFGRGQLLDAATHYIVMPDGIGTGKSSRPSEGLHMRFPRYGYADMVLAQHRLLTECLSVDHLRLVMGTSMGGMQTWMWGYTYPGFMDALLPLASLPVEIAGRNRMLRKMFVDAIENDPEWKRGEYTAQPRGLIDACHIYIFMVSCPLEWQKEAPTRVEAEAMLERLIKRYSSPLDANDAIYQFEASRDYNPLPHLEEIRAPLYAINSADDQVNPPELGILDQAIHQVAHGRYILLPVSPETRGHGTHSLPAIWGRYLGELLAASEPAAAARR